MFDHVQLRVRDFQKSLRFYTEALRPLGYVAQYVDEEGESAGFGPEGDPRLWIGAAGELAPSAASHLAFAAKDHDAVGRFHAAALAAGGHDHGKPGPRTEYHPKYYAAFVIDPDGHNIEAVAPR